MSFFLLLQLNPYLTYIIAALIGLIIGSFLNVVITRYPIILNHVWRQECLTLLQQPLTAQSLSISLSKPGSQCPHCHTPIKIQHNIPILSYLFLRGKCYHCKQKIPLRYPLVEAISALTTAIILDHFGLNWCAIAAALLNWGLIVLAAIDAEEKILPDDITLSLLWLGLISSLFHWFISPTQAIIGASIGYLLLWSIAKLYLKIRHYEGMGNGDFKMLALLGAWVGINGILNVLIIATTLGILYGLLRIATKRSNYQQTLAFGPFLAIAGWLTLLLGPFIVNILINLGNN